MEEVGGGLKEEDEDWSKVEEEGVMEGWSEDMIKKEEVESWSEEMMEEEVKEAWSANMFEGKR